MTAIGHNRTVDNDLALPPQASSDVPNWARLLRVQLNWLCLYTFTAECSNFISPRKLPCTVTPERHIGSLFCFFSRLCL